MKKTISGHLQSKVFRRYLASYISVILITLAVISIIVMQNMANNMKKEGIRLTESKLHTVVEDLEFQMDAVRRMVVEISAMQEFRTDYFLTNKYREIELLDRLAAYRQNFYICDDYFVKYTFSDMLFTSGGKVVLDTAYLDSWIIKEDRQELITLLDQLGDKPIENLVIYSADELTFLLFPLKKYAYSEKGLDGTICYIISEVNILERIEKVVGSLDGQMVLYYQEYSLLEQKEEGKEEPLVMNSSNGNFKILFWPDETEYFSWGNVFSMEATIILASIIELVLGFGFVIAYWNYLPIRKITDKYKNATEIQLSPDWESLESLLDNMMQGRERNIERLKKQRSMLKEQTIRVIASGGYNEKCQEYMTLLSIKLPGPVYAIMELSFTEANPVDMFEKINPEMEALSGDGLVFYAYFDNGLKVFVSAEEDYLLEEATEKLQALMDALEIKGITEICGISHDIKITKLEPGKIRDKKDENQIAGDKNTIGWKALKYIKEHCAEYDLSLEKVADEFQITSTYLSYVIKEQTGVSYKKYLTELRIEEAKRLLRETDMRIIDVSDQTGYNDVSYFIKVFQRYTGMTPAKFREEGNA